MGINRDKVLASAQKQVRKGNWDKAIDAYESLVEDDPSDVRSRLKIGDLYVKANDFDSALHSYQEVAYLYAKDDFYEKAAAVYKQALRIAPENPTLHRDLGEAYFRLGRLKDAVRAFQRAQKLFRASGDDQQQRVILERMTEIDPHDVGLKVQLAERYEKDGFREQALELFHEAAQTLYEEGRNDEFVQVGERIVFLDPEAHSLRKDIIRIYIERADDRRALKHLQAAFRKTPKDVQILEMLAKTFGRVGNPEKAVLVYQELANAFVTIGQDERAKNAYRAILELDPEHQVARRELAEELEESETFRERDTGSISTDPATQDLEGIEFLDEEGDLDGVEFLDDDASFDGPDPSATHQANDFLRFAEETVAGVDADLGRLDSDPASSLGSRHTEVSDITNQIVEEVHESPTEDQPATTEDEISAMLTETDVFLKYGLFDRAENTITRIIELAPENLKAREQMRRFFELTGEREAAAGQLIRMARIVQESPDRAAEYLRRALDTTDHPDRVEEMAQRMGIDLEGSEDVVEIGAEFIDEISEGISEASGVFDRVDEPGAHTVDLEPEVGAGLSGESAVEDDGFEGLGAVDEVDDLAGMLIEEMDAAEFEDIEAIDVDSVAVAEDVEMIAPLDIDEEIEIADFDEADMADFDELDELQDVDAVGEFDETDFEFGDAEELQVEGEVMELDIDDVDFDGSELDALQDAIDDADFEFSFTEGEADEMFDELFGGSSLELELDTDDVSSQETNGGFNPFGEASLSGKFAQEVSEMTEYSDGTLVNSNLELGATYREMGLWAEALDEFEQALDDPEAEHAANFNIALCEIELGDEERAIERLQELAQTSGAPSPIRNAARAKLEELSSRKLAGT